LLIKVVHIKQIIFGETVIGLSLNNCLLILFLVILIINRLDYQLHDERKDFFMQILKFFTLKVYDGKGRYHICSLRERIKWLLQGRPLRSKKVVDRAIKIAHNNR